MQESIRKITISVISFIIIGVIMYNYTANDLSKHKNIKGIGIYNRTINVNILDEKIFCKEEIVFELTSWQEIKYEFFPDEEHLNNVKIKFKNDDDFYSLIFNNNLEAGRISMYEDWVTSIANKDKTLTIKLEYELDKDFIIRYTDKDVLSYYIDVDNVDYLNKLTINISSNENISNIEVEDATISKIKNRYISTINNLKESKNINILFNINTEINNTISSKYIDEEAEKYSYIKERINILVICVIISVILFIVSVIINKKIKVTNYRRETSNLVSPILAEAIVDGKIGLKEIIMTTIIDLNIRGNIKIINNDIIELISIDNLEYYEKSIVELLFENNTRIKFMEINDIFAKSNQGTLNFAKKMSNIKALLSEKIYSMNIFSKGLTFINKVLALIAILISINLPQILFEYFFGGGMYLVLVSFLMVKNYIKKHVKKTSIQEEIINDNKGNNADMIIITIAMLFILAETLIAVAKYNIVILIIMVLTIDLNIYTVYKNQGTVLTRTGKSEQAKLLELKKYINDYSLIKNRDLESVIIWDEYLAYATAFGIPNRVTDTIYEGWYNLNINLQVLESILR